MVMDMVPAEKLLIMDVEEGWTPLCEFLDMAVPEGPLPRANDTESANEVAADITGRVFQIWASGIGTVVTATAIITAMYIA
ncbi:hypothetical protein BJ166DRAFT_532247 [Pestalotiopsis sp. NC0098]|nr:hypothetical protein BJ166DRAFT_532247 [Pestalotiopsis sp. NC0098]